MIFIPIEFVKPGMVLAKDVIVSFNNVPLITKGQKLNYKVIDKIQKIHLSGVYIESNLCNDIEVKEFINPKLKNQTLSGIKKVYDEFTKECEINCSDVQHISVIARNLVTNILSKDEIVVNMIELKGYDDYTYHHSLCVALLSISIGVKLGFSSDMLVELATSALLHDIGKMNIPIEILNKPSKLTETEFAIIKEHPLSAFNELKRQKILSKRELEGIGSHHEKYNGTGYPYGLAKDNIPLYGRILAVADVYDAITSKRPYRVAYFPNEAIEYLMCDAEVHFDHEVLLTFLKIVAAYPTGTIITLSNGQTAVVVKNHEENTLRPVVRVLNNDETCSKDMDLLYEREYYNITITGMGYNNEDVHFQKV